MLTTLSAMVAVSTEVFGCKCSSKAFFNWSRRPCCSRRSLSCGQSHFLRAATCSKAFDLDIAKPHARVLNSSSSSIIGMQPRSLVMTSLDTICPRHCTCEWYISKQKRLPSPTPYSVDKAQKDRLLCNSRGTTGLSLS